MNATPGLEGAMAVVGAGNMAEALVRGMIKSKLLPSRSLRVTDIEPGRLDYFKANFGIAGFERNGDGVRGAQVVILAVKPQVMAAVATEVGAALDPGALVISIAAGVTTRRLEELLPPGTRVVRVMPNMPALAGAGVSAYCLGSRAVENDAGLAAAVFQSVGAVVRLDEKDMDAVTALSGSGPAYVFFLAEVMIRAGIAMGLGRATSRKLALGTVSGAARLLAESGAEPGELRQRVTSRGGTTAAALDVLESGRVAETFIKAIRAAQKRSRDLAG